MNVLHLHLLFNHFPTVGNVIGLGLFLFAILGKNDELKRVSLGVFFVIALLTLPAYMSGNGAVEVVQGNPEVSQALIDRHQDVALTGLLFMQITGALAWFALWKYRRTSSLANWNVMAVLLLSILTLGLMAQAAN